MGFDGNWGPAFTTFIAVEDEIFADAPVIQEARFWWNNDEQNAQLLLAFDNNFDEAFESVFANGAVVPETGIHTLNIQVRGFDGNFSPAFTTVVSVENPIAIPDLGISAARYFWNGNEAEALTLIAFDGDFDEAFEQVQGDGMETPGLGIHTPHVQVANENGALWRQLHCRCERRRRGKYFRLITLLNALWRTLSSISNN